MKTVKLVIAGNPATKKNSNQIVYKKVGCRQIPIIIPSKAYRNYEKEFVKQFVLKYSELALNIESEVNLKCLYYMETRRKVDLVNLLEATQDCLVKCGVLADDNCTIIKTVNGSEVFYDKENPRVEIIIE